MIRYITMFLCFLPMILSAQIDDNQDYYYDFDKDTYIYYDNDAYVLYHGFDCSWLVTRPLTSKYSLSLGMCFAESSIEPDKIGGGMNISMSLYPWYIVDGINLNYVAGVDFLNSKDKHTYIYSGGAEFSIRFSNPNYLHCSMSFISRIAYISAPSYTEVTDGEGSDVNASKMGVGADIIFGVGKKNLVFETFAAVINTKENIYQKYGMQIKVLF